MFLDYDGTLVSLTSQPELAKPSGDLMNLLDELKQAAPLYLVTGRDLEGIASLVGDGLNIIALHGAQGINEDGRKWEIENFPSYVRRTMELKKKYAYLEEEFPGLRVIDKGGGLQFHYYDVNHSQRTLLKKLAGGIREEGFEMYHGKLIYELRIRGINKGIAISRFLGEGDFVLFPGDDRTDEEAFRVLKSHLTIKVGKGATNANFRLKSPNDVTLLLKYLLNNRYLFRMG